ncbi:MAG: hypothetical protein ACD_80C00121G0007 [uncultured bacterium (gcode 4)]|uniref:Uncharacterized protein n=1 Tax=uncultured bacterium (gcode 4) TaxID=1234023 RepID=K1YI98_9BACT|nr:MAG: hypothetical protein ACD_80C00121G0007 [uncultured bacterium (gcode 4)]
MKYIKKIFLLIIMGAYLAHSSFASGLWFLWHHEISVNQNDIETSQSCWTESKNCCSTTDNCATLCIVQEYQISSISDLKLHDHNDQCNNNSLGNLSIYEYRLEDLYVIYPRQSFSLRNILVFDAKDLVWIIKLTI